MKMQNNTITIASLAVLMVMTYRSFIKAADDDSQPAANCPAASGEVQLELTGQSFEELQARSQHFADELGRLKEEQQTVPPEQLVEQANAEKTCSIATQTGASEKLSPEAIYARSKPAVVVLGGIFKCTKCQRWHSQCASGFVIHKDGLILTNRHVVEGFKKLEAVGAMTDDGRVFPVKEVLASSRLNDLAVLKLAAENLQPLPVAKEVAVGATIYCLSHPVISEGKVNCFYTFTPGIVAGKFSLRTEKQQILKVLAVTTEYGPGSSGGPILNEQGAVVAVACQAIPLTKQDQPKSVPMVWKFARPACNILLLLGQTDAHGKSADNREP